MSAKFSHRSASLCNRVSDRKHERIWWGELLLRVERVMLPGRCHLKRSSAPASADSLVWLCNILQSTATPAVVPVWGRKKEEGTGMVAVKGPYWWETKAASVTANASKHGCH